MTTGKYRPVLVRTICILICFMLILFSDTAFSAAENAIELTLRSVIPVLLPYAVLSNIISDLQSSDSKISAIITAFIIGNICGAPVGAISISRLYANGVISKKEAGCLLPSVSCVSPAFCIIAVGSNMLKNKAFGVFIWSTQLVINAVILAFYLIYHAKSKEKIPIIAKKKSTFADAIKRSGGALCSVSVSIVLFSVISAVISEMLHLNGLAECVISAVFEFCGGCERASALYFPMSFIICSFALGFGGLSVYSQICASTSDISKTRYLVTKLITGSISSLNALLYSAIFVSSIENLTK